MGVVFALGFVLVLMLAVGVVCIFTGTMILVVRYIKKRKNQKKYMISKILGIVILIFGMLVAAGPVILGILVGIEVVEDRALHRKYQDYFKRYEETAVQIAVEADSIRNEIVYLKNSFEYQNKVYYRVSGLDILLEDPYRGEAVANLNDGVTKLTVYEYLYPENCELLCVGERIYCTQEKADELKEFYNHQRDFSYQYRYITNSSSYYVDVEMEDDMFLGLINYNRKYVSDSGDFIGAKTEYNIIQFAEEGRLERTLNVMLDEEGNIMVKAISNPLGNYKADGSQKPKRYIVTNPEAAKMLREIGEAIVENRAE